MSWRYGRGLASRASALALAVVVLAPSALPSPAAASAGGGLEFDLEGVLDGISRVLPRVVGPTADIPTDGTTHDISPSTPWTRFEGPVNAVAGNLAFGVVDLSHSRRSASRPRSAARTTVASTGSGVLGHRWTWSYGITALESPDEVRVTWGDGRLDRYTESAPDTWDPPTGIHDTLLRNGDGTLRLRAPDQTVYRFDVDGRLRFHHRRARQPARDRLRCWSAIAHHRHRRPRVDDRRGRRSAASRASRILRTAPSGIATTRPATWSRSPIPSTTPPSTGTTGSIA